MTTELDDEHQTTRGTDMTTTPSRYRDRHGDIWQQQPDGRLALMTGPRHGPEGGPLSTICVYTRSEVERVDGPLTEIKAATR